MFTPVRLIGGLAAVLLAIDFAGIALLAGTGSWDPVLLATLAVLVLSPNLAEIRLKGCSLSGDGVGLVIAMALLGPAQAAVLAIVSSLHWAYRTPGRLSLRTLSVAQYGVVALAGGLVLRETAVALEMGKADVGFAIPVLTGFTTMFVLNVVIMFVAGRVLEGEGFWHSVRTIAVPLLPSEAAMILLASIIIYAEVHLGVVAFAMLIALIFLYVFLLKELVVSQERAEELQLRTKELASLQVGVLTAMLRTLSMRDQMTARHSAAVARYARAIAKAAGCTPHEQELAHTAGLLHDIGKFILPDHILLADTKLGQDDWRLIRMHPYQGAKVVREVDGYGPIADIIWCHHERIDGRGYPRGLAGDDIPLISRMISIADTYDVMTARDSYRDPVSSAEAIEELRRVSGFQLDGRLVEVFIGVLKQQDIAFQHTDDTDFETELAFERRVRDYAEPKAHALPAAA